MANDAVRDALAELVACEKLRANLYATNDDAEALRRNAVHTRRIGPAMDRAVAALALPAGAEPVAYPPREPTEAMTAAGRSESHKVGMPVRTTEARVWRAMHDAAPTTPIREELTDAEIARRIVLAVAELPDRNSPEDQPAMMLVTGEELYDVVLAALGAANGK